MDFCASNNCKYGNCLSEEYGYRCKCYAGFEGEMCDIEVDSCAINRCENEGKCINENVKF